MNGFPEDNKLQRFTELRSGPHYGTVISACRAYLTAALPNPPHGAGERWVLTCLPTTKTPSGFARLSAVSMRNMETFVLHVDADGMARGFVTIHGMRILTEYGSKQALEQAFGLDDTWSRPYQAAGADQLTLLGSAASLLRLMDNERIAGAARSLASSLTDAKCVYARHHNSHLTNAVLAS